MNRALPVAFACLLVLGGCSTIVPRGPPNDDRIGWEDGHWYDSKVSVTVEDGLNASERRDVVARTMARVEVIRNKEFEERVPVTVITRAEYRERRRNRSGERRTYNAWNNQVWEAALLVGEDTDVSKTFDAIFGTSVQGFYSPSEDRIVLVSDSDTPRIDTRTLAHELVHALQDQHYRLAAGATTQDAQLAEDGLVEGDANTVQSMYEARCGRDWACLPRPPGRGGGTPTNFDFGVFLTIFTPYAEGPEFVAALRSRGGGDWSRVDAAYDAFPASTEQVIHPGRYPDDRPTNVTVRDRSNREWHRFDLDQQADTLGEATIYATFWANGQVDRSRNPYNYSHPLSTGWDGDAVVPYTNGSAAGYVWKLTFDSRGDARAFHDAYRRVLRSRGARSPRPGVFVIPNGPFADAFEVTRRGDTVRVVNAPTTGDLDEIHA